MMPMFPSLLSMPYLGAIPASDPVYKNTGSIFSTRNPFYFKGKAAEVLAVRIRIGSYLADRLIVRASPD